MKVIGGRGSIRNQPVLASTNDYDNPDRRVSNRSTKSASMYEGSTLNTMIRPPLVLHPEIAITPEVQSVESGSCTFWVGISITAKLNRADGELDLENFMQNLGMSSSKQEAA